MTAVDLVWNQIQKQDSKQEGFGRQLTEKPFESSRDHRLIGFHTYNILSNPYYYLKYMYIPYTVPKRAEYIVSMYKDKELRKLNKMGRCECKINFLVARLKAMKA